MIEKGRNECSIRGLAATRGQEGSGSPWLRSARRIQAITLKVTSDDIEELRRALLNAYGDVIRELGQVTCLRGPSEAGIQLCRRKWKLEAMLGQLEGPEGPPAVLEIVPRRDHAALEQAAA